jgi:hypothetical protein|tara:strand:+ start:369 stop:623 length:255 start_codon:yes stop_codon:yes gene_type:complete
MPRKTTVDVSFHVGDNPQLETDVRQYADGDHYVAVKIDGTSMYFPTVYSLLTLAVACSTAAKELHEALAAAEKEIPPVEGEVSG